MTEEEREQIRKARATLISKPEGILEACPGKTLMNDIEILNDTDFKWRNGITFTLAEEQSFTECPIEAVNVPMEVIEKKQSQKASFPLTVLSHIKASDDTVYTINFICKGHEGETFGEIIPVQLKVVAQQAHTDVEIAKLAIKLSEMNLGSFEECAKAVKENDCDEAKTIKALQ